jgi:hypothetical protein
MSMSQEASKNIGNLCCGPWSRQGHPARKRRFGILLVIIGLIWLGARLGLLNFSWLQTVPFWPTALILLGVWMVYDGFMREYHGKVKDKTRGAQNDSDVQQDDGGMHEGHVDRG